MKKFIEDKNRRVIKYKIKRTPTVELIRVNSKYGASRYRHPEDSINDDRIVFCIHG